VILYLAVCHFKQLHSQVERQKEDLLVNKRSEGAMLQKTSL